MHRLLTFPSGRKGNKGLPRNFPGPRGDAMWFLTKEASGGNMLGTESILPVGFDSPRNPLIPSL